MLKCVSAHSFPSVPPQPVQQLWSSDEEPAENRSYFLPCVPPGALVAQQRQRHGLQWQQDSSQPGLQGQYKLTLSVLRTIWETLVLCVFLCHTTTTTPPMHIMFLKVTWKWLVLIFIQISLENSDNVKKVLKQWIKFCKTCRHPEGQSHSSHIMPPEILPFVFPLILCASHFLSVSYSHWSCCGTPLRSGWCSSPQRWTGTGRTRHPPPPAAR